MPRRPADPNWKTVYSTHRAPEPAPPPEGDGGAGSDKLPRAARMRLETKGRAGKAVTVIALAGGEEPLRRLARELKSLCGAGGTIKVTSGTAEIEVQGDHRDKVEVHLRGCGFSVKRTGG